MLWYLVKHPIPNGKGKYFLPHAHDFTVVITAKHGSSMVSGQIQINQKFFDYSLCKHLKIILLRWRDNYLKDLTFLQCIHLQFEHAHIFLFLFWARSILCPRPFVLVTCFTTIIFSDSGPFFFLTTIIFLLTAVTFSDGGHFFPWQFSFFCFFFLTAIPFSDHFWLKMFDFLEQGLVLSRFVFLCHLQPAKCNLFFFSALFATFPLIFSDTLL